MFSFIVDACNGLIKLLGMALGLVLGLLPNSPFTNLDLSGLEKTLGYVNWFFPVGTCVIMFTAWLTCVGSYYLYSIVLRWIKAVS